MEISTSQDKSQLKHQLNEPLFPSRFEGRNKSRLFRDISNAMLRMLQFRKPPSPLEDCDDKFTDMHARALENLDPENAFVKQIKYAIDSGCTFNQLLNEYPQALIAIIRELGLKSLGSFYEHDYVVYSAFKDRVMLTKSDGKSEAENAAAIWKDELKRRAGRAEKSLLGSMEAVKIDMYSVNINNSCASNEKGVLRVLLDMEKTLGDKINLWDYPLVQAVIEFKWHYWAKSFLRVEFAFYGAWVLSFVGFLLIYIELEDQDRDLSQYDNKEYIQALGALLCNASATLFTVPFIISEICFLTYRGWRSFNLWTLIHLCSITLQVLILVSHATRWWFNCTLFNTVLAAQSLLLSLQLPYFARLVKMDASFVESLVALVISIRFFLYFTVMIIAGLAFSFAVLYKEDVEAKHHANNKNQQESSTSAHEEEVKQSIEDFGSFPRSLGTTFAVLLGNFETSYVYQTSNRAIKELFFFFLQLFLIIILLNVLIAVMSDAYTKIMQKKRPLFYHGRAKLIDKIECFLPSKFYPSWEPYVHFIVINRPKTHEYRLEALETEETERHVSLLEYRANVKQIENRMKIVGTNMGHLDSKVEGLKKSLEKLHEKIDRLSK